MPETQQKPPGRECESSGRPAATPEPRSGELQVRGITKTYGHFVALQGIDFSVRAGEFVTLLGPSGSGKTTTLKLVAGLERPTGGQIIIDGRDITDVPARHRNLGLVFQQYALFPHMTVAQNIAYPLLVRRRPKRERDERVRELLEIASLHGLSERRPAELSGGQQQRVAVMRALAHEPPVVLLDEPLGALDRRLREQMQIELKRIQSQVGVTMIYVTHDQDEALALSDRIIVMTGGRIEQIGTPEEIYASPSTAFVADFVGLGNGIEGVAASAPVDGFAWVELAGLGRIRGRAPASLTPGQRISVLIRPEHVEIAEGPLPGENAFRIAALLAKTYLGNVSRFRLRTAQGCVLQAEAHAGIDVEKRLGSDCHVRIASENVLILS